MPDQATHVLVLALAQNLRQFQLGQTVRRDEVVGERGLEDIRVRFRLRLRELCQQRGLSQEELAFRSRVHRTYVSLTDSPASFRSSSVPGQTPSRPRVFPSLRRARAA
ncbi:MAG TPA: helix-turn-helix transcriptional regulator [Thermoleophilia bacterium]|nr:helix-turn-helix transcriptional regulator [Thermoleophilia bacterium]